MWICSHHPDKIPFSGFGSKIVQKSIKYYGQGCGSGSALIFPSQIWIQERKLKKLQQKTARTLVIIVVLLNFVILIWTSPMTYFTLEQWYRVFKAGSGPDPHFKKTAGSGSALRKQLDPETKMIRLWVRKFVKQFRKYVLRTLPKLIKEVLV